MEEVTFLLWQHTTTLETRKTNLDFCLNFCANEVRSVQQISNLGMA